MSPAPRQTRARRRRLHETLLLDPLAHDRPDQPCRYRTTPASDLDALAALPVQDGYAGQGRRAGQAAALGRWRVIALLRDPARVPRHRSSRPCRTWSPLMWGAEDLVAAIGGPFQPPWRRPLPRRRPARPVAAYSSRPRRVDRRDRRRPSRPRRPRRPARRDRGRGRQRFRREGLHPSAAGRGRPRRLPADRREVRRAQRVLAAAAGAAGVFAFEGRMVDAPVLRHAEHVARAAERLGSG